jgi:hypothetical protein
VRAHRRRARTAIVGGSQIAIVQAPWQVFVEASIPAEGKALVCGGSILDPMHILTAAHCLFNHTSHAEISPSDIYVAAGTADINSHEPQQQISVVASVRVHPYFVFDPNSGQSIPDDVAVLELAEPFTLQSGPGASVSSIGMVAGGTPLAEGTPLQLTGFGQQSPSSEPDGKLYGIPLTLGPSRACGREADALFVCASDATGALCSGDSGSGLTSSGLAPVLVGVVDTGEVIAGVPCGAGSRGGFANVAAPEIQDFIDGSEAPPRAPRGGGPALSGTPMVGDTLTCQPGGWSGEPAFTYVFLDGSSGQVLQAGASSSYTPTTADLGRTILCQVQAANAGGTGVDESAASAAILAAPAQVKKSLPVFGLSLLSSGIAIKSGHVALVKLACKRSQGCTGKLTLSATRTTRKGGKHVSRNIRIGTAKFSIADNARVTIKLSLDAAGRTLLSAAHGRLNARLSIVELGPGEASHSKVQQVRLLAQSK